MPNSTTEFAFYLLGSAIGTSIGLAFLWAFVLRVAAQRLYSYDIRFSEAYRICLIGLLAGNLLWVVTVLTFPSALVGAWYLLFIGVFLLLYSALAGQMIRIAPAKCAGLKVAFTFTVLKLLVTFAVVITVMVVLGLFKGAV